MVTSITGILDYGVSGNLYNVQKAVEKAGGKVLFVKTPADCQDIERLILPGVGNFHDTITDLGNDVAEFKEIISKIPTLGICLGMQLLARVGFEGGKTEGFGFFDAEVKKMEVSGRVPHLGWGKIEVLNDSPLLKGITTDSQFYFMHSYEMISYKNLVAITEYSSHKFVSVIQKDHIHGVQFHPEKSREAGIQIIRNFLTL